MLDLLQLKREMCDVGHQLWQRGLVAGSDGNLSVRLSENQILCTPTRQSKGTLTPDGLCVVDFEGNQLDGARPRSSEILLHLEILKQRPDVGGIVHCHPPHATAFAVTGRQVPTGVMPETDVFLGEVPLAPYETPGTAAFAETVLPYVHRSNVCLLANHGTVAFGNSLAVAYELTEYLEATCRILWLAEALGPVQPLPADKRGELAEIRRRAGLEPPDASTYERK